MKTIYVLIISLILISCTSTTESLWENPSYKEKIGRFLISEGGTKLAIIGEKYHYIFDLDKELKNILLSTIRASLKPSFYSFKVDENNNISGKFILYYSSDNKKDIEWLTKSGFINKTRRNDKLFTYTFLSAINGKRYSTTTNANKSIDFSKPYFLKIEEPSSLLSSTGKIVATPITVAADGVMTISGVVFFTAFTTAILIRESEK
ncbi:MAG: hypothetical protein KJO47_05515 [Gammaproteobacteria bacterium]|nr:hypothetical protein [Gammaproteobacteria bacterium]